LFFDTFQEAKRGADSIRQSLNGCDQLNLVIREHGNMDDPDLLALGKIKIFAGTAWALIHDRRVQDGWYNEPQ
jgi:hypothetical protein